MGFSIKILQKKYPLKYLFKREYFLKNIFLLFIILKQMPYDLKVQYSRLI